MEKDKIKEEVTNNSEKVEKKSIKKKQYAKKEDKEKKEIKTLKKEIDKIKKENENLQNEIERVSNEKQQYYDKLARLLADFDNFRKRAEEEKRRIIKTANEDLVKDLFPVLDALDMAIKNSEKMEGNEEFKSGITLVRKLFGELLEKYGVKEIEALNKVFDPNFHDALMMVEDGEHEEDELVVEEFQKGYMLNGKVIRPAKVKVSKKKN